ncbi:uncharacterized protein LOC116689395 [Etheostoma spectabile]|uniref:uncharacterized protein LOC116689395 n=1 Tax=Etheostoma spectabile TaxID=54343 RepID=UPI0013AFBFBF|nr:uncharacterized protein LOC116689395 [Etheostoma spectabile]XP_032371818.1 uncharacterized protein LOC116689395 [Etheostoma spectabile]XP_032371819.1 uncharacterized protein LOC116689395 [Etheostoma spectabile]
MMDDLTSNNSHIPCQSWAGQNGWSTASTQGPHLNPLPSSQRLSLRSSRQRPSYDHLQASNQSCMSDLGTISSRNDPHHSDLYKDSQICNNPSSTTQFAIPSASHIISFAQQSPHTSSLLLNANQEKHIPSLHQTNQAPHPCSPQKLPLSHNSYNAPFQPPVTDRLQSQPISRPSCGQLVNASQATFEGAYVEFARVAGRTHSHASSPPQEQRQWKPSSHSSRAVNESVPDAASHPNKDPLKEGNISPQASNEKRLELLHQRAHLLQQLAELDALLESTPPEDSSEGQSPHTAAQSQSVDHSSQCEETTTSDAQQVQQSAAKSESQWHPSSPVSCDEQSETSDTPEDPMSAAESEKIENSSVNSEDDSDPDYLPARNGDISDVPDGGSSDESNHSRPSTPTDEQPSLPGKKRAKSASFLFKEKGASPPKQIRVINWKKSSETVVLPISGSKAHRVYDRRNYCLFCSKPVSKMSRHLESIHSDKAEVAAAFQYPKHSRERQKIWNKLTNQGNFAHNKDVLKTGKGTLAVRKRPNTTQKARDFVHCLYCQGLFLKTALHRHIKFCPERDKKENELVTRRKSFAFHCVLETYGELGISDGFKEVLSNMAYDDVTQAIMEDEVILQFGELLFNKHGSDPKKHDYIRQNLRQIARLVLEARKITPLEKLQDFFLPSSFPHVVSAVNVVAGYDPENKTHSIPSLAIKLGYSLQKTCSIVEANAQKCGDESLAESAQNFLSVYQKEWNKLISAGALKTLRDIKLNTKKKVPFAQDVKLLNFHMENVHSLAEKKLRDSNSAENYAALARVILSRIILYNRRKAGEVSSVQLKAFMSRKKSNSHDAVDPSASSLEKKMCRFFTRVDIRGQCGRMLPVLLKPSFVSALELLVQLRETCGVPSKNPFLFGRPRSPSAYNGAACIRTYVKACGAKDPEILTVARIQKHYTTMLQMINLDENEANQILGPNNKVQSLREDSSMQLDDVEMDSDDHHEQTRGAATRTNMTVSKKSVKSGKKGSQNNGNGKQKWEEAEILAVERHMMALIKGHKVPQKSDCIQCLEAEPEALRTRSWKGVKDYVRNRITALKRQSGTSKAT